MRGCTTERVQLWHYCKNSHTYFYTPPHKKWRALQTISVHPSCHSSVCLSVSASFPDSNLSIFWPNSFKLCMNIDIREEWFGIANGLNSFITTELWPLVDVKKCVFPQYLQNKWMI